MSVLFSDQILEGEVEEEFAEIQSIVREKYSTYGLPNKHPSHVLHMKDRKKNISIADKELFTKDEYMKIMELLLSDFQTKSDIVARVHELGFTKKRSVDIIETLLEIIKSNLEKSEDVLISGFGKFCVKNKKQRRGRNPSTGEDLMLRERRVVTFKCSGKLRKKINGAE